ncbi:hypothetical protein [Neorhizobium sp. NCHU2750]|uniref:hypothetical protein n=1 Tax=Neorhizobium sp. NCHU2750 TaxID=1825976 RepID=UPI000E70B322
MAPHIAIGFVIVTALFRIILPMMVWSRRWEAALKLVEQIAQRVVAIAVATSLDQFVQKVDQALL